jgi:hypothetical protein
MKTPSLKSIATAVAAALAVGLAACGDRPSDADKVGQANPPPMASRDRPADPTQPKTADADAAKTAREAGKVVDDAALTNRVKDALGAEPDLKTVSINVDSSGGVITLKGTTDSQDKRKKAEQVAENVAGVRSVRNEMVVIKG